MITGGIGGPDLSHKIALRIFKKTDDFLKYIESKNNMLLEQKNSAIKYHTKYTPKENQPVLMKVTQKVPITKLP